MEQGSLEWHEARRGSVTASRVADVLAKTKTGVSASRSNYLIELALQRATGIIEPSYSNQAMEHGKEFENSARVAFEVSHNVFVDQVAFIKHPSIEWFGCSPDGLVGNDALIEIKCPFSSSIHWSYFKSGAPSKYVTQMQAQMACVGKHIEYVWFVSYDPRMPEKCQLYVEQIMRDKDFIEKMEEEVQQFLNEVAVETDLMRG